MKAWVISADMGYGHQRAAYPLRDLAYERIITANSDKIISEDEQKQWDRFETMYESLSRWRSLPIIGPFLWHLYDRLQKIAPIYPFRDLSQPGFGTWYLRHLIRKGFAKSVLDYTRKKDLPIVSTFFAPAVAGAYHGIKDVYCVVTDSDINRVWVPYNHRQKITYLTPTKEASLRLQEYGVPRNHIVYTGFPLPEELLGPRLHVLKKNLGMRLAILDPHKRFISRYKETVSSRLGNYIKLRPNRPLTITFAIGGAGAQKEQVAQYLHSFSNRIRQEKLRVYLVAGTHLDVTRYFRTVLHSLHLESALGKQIFILTDLDKKDYFEHFNYILHTTDILWTKPSELSFYMALGIPLLLAPALGAHEVLNARWVTNRGGGIHQENPIYAEEWLMHWVHNGAFAEAAFNGFLKAPKYGTQNIRKVLMGKNSLRY